MRRVADWVRFRGWRNAYWREDAAAWRCPHPVAMRWTDPDLASYELCGWCGTALASSNVPPIRTTASNVTIFRRIVL